MENDKLIEKLTKVEEEYGITITVINHKLLRKIRKLSFVLATVSSITLLGTVVIQTSPDLVRELPPVIQRIIEDVDDKLPDDDDEDDEIKEEPMDTVEKEDSLVPEFVEDIIEYAEEPEKKPEKPIVEHKHNMSDWSYLNDNLEHRICSDDGYEETRGHTLGAWVYNSATGMEECTCATCGHVFQRQHQHKMENYTFNPAGNNEVSTCSVCGQQEFRACEMTDWTVVNGTTEERHCTHGCGHTEQRAHEHMHALSSTPKIGTIYSEADRCHSEYYECTAPGCPDNGIVNMHDVGHSYGAAYEVPAGRGTVDKYEDCSICGYHHYLGTIMPETAPNSITNSQPDPATPDPATPDPSQDPTARLRILSNSIKSALLEEGINIDFDFNNQEEHSKSKSA